MSMPPTYGPPPSKDTAGQPHDPPAEPAASAQPATPPLAPSTAPGYTPPGAVPAPAAPAANTGYTPPGAGTQANSTNTSTAATGYTPPRTAPAPPPAPGSAAPTPHPTPARGAASGTVAAPSPAPRPAQEPDDAASDTEVTQPTAPRRTNPLVLVVGGLIALVIVGLVVAWLLGAFSPKLSHLPTRVGDYTMDTSTQRSSGATLDSATYRAGAGDIYQASIIRDAADPTIAYGKAAADARFQHGNVTCVEVSKTGKGGTCGVALANGSVVRVQSSTRHTAVETAQFTADVAAGVR